MLCQNCGNNEANIIYTQIINGNKKEIAICHDCAKKLGINGWDMPDFPINFNSFLGDFFNDYAESALLPSFSNNVLKCKTCGLTYDDFIETGLFGCSDCYETFSNPINSLLKNLHGTAKHIGRGSASKTNEVKKESKKFNNDAEPQDNEIQRLQKELDKAVAEERYEDAAHIKSEIDKKNSK